jgi:hypothetical protein
MPKILLVNVSPQLATSLRANADYDVTRAVLGATMAPDLPDPREFDIIVDNRCSSNHEGESLFLTDDTLTIKPLYLQYLKDSRGLIYAPHGPDWGDFGNADERLIRVSPKSFPAFVRPQMIPKDDHAACFHDFIDQFGTYMRPRAFGVDTGLYAAGPVLEDPRVYFCDEYGQPRIFSYRMKGETVRVLLTPNIQPLEQKLRAIQFLVDKVFPLLHPQAYTDVLVPRPLQGLVHQYKQLQADFRQSIADLEARVADEQSFYAPYKPLVRLLGNQLKGLVKGALQDLWGLHVDDLDEGKKEGEPKRSDLLLTHNAWRALVEVTGSAGRAGRGMDLEAFEDNIRKEEAELGKIDARVLIFNHLTARPLAERLQTNAFSQDIRDDANRLGIGLMSCFDLFGAVERARQKALDAPGLVGLMSRSGHIEIWTPG